MRYPGTLVFLALLLLLVGTAQSAVYHVATTGTDSAACSPAAPCATIAKGLTKLGPGDTLYLRGGTYHEIVTTGFPSGTSWNAPVTLSGFPGESVTVVGYIAVTDGLEHVPKYVIVQDFTIDAVNSCRDCNGIYIQASYTRVQRMEIKNYNNMGVQASPVKVSPH